MDRVQASFDEAEKKLSTGRGNVIRQAELLKGMGIGTDKSIDGKLLAKSRDYDETLNLE